MGKKMEFGFRPYVGKDYYKTSRNLLIVGASHYCAADDCDIDFTSRCMEKYLAYKQGIAESPDGSELSQSSPMRPPGGNSHRRNSSHSIGMPPSTTICRSRKGQRKRKSTRKSSVILSIYACSKRRCTNLSRAWSSSGEKKFGRRSRRIWQKDGNG